MELAVRAGARFAVILEEGGTVTVKRLEDGQEQSVPMTDVAAWIGEQT